MTIDEQIKELTEQAASISKAINVGWKALADVPMTPEQRLALKERIFAAVEELKQVNDLLEAGKRMKR